MVKMKEIYLIPDINNLEKTMELAKKYNACFEYNDFFLPQVLDDEEEVKRRIQIYKSLDRDRSRDTLHGTFLDIVIHSQDEKIRKVSEQRVRQSLSIAQDLGIRGCVFHANLIAGYYSELYLQGWLDASISFWKKMLTEYPLLEIYIENMFENRIEDLKKLAEAMSDEPRFGICLDYAHSQLYGKDGLDWINEMAPYIRHCHINDNDLYDDRHWEVGSGKLDWDHFNERIRNNHIEPTVLIEVRDLDMWQGSAEFMKKSGIYPY